MGVNNLPRAVAAVGLELATSESPVRCLKLEFHDADTDANTEILARILEDTSDARDFPKLNDTPTFSRQCSRGCRRGCRCRYIGVVECGL